MADNTIYLIARIKQNGRIRLTPEYGYFTSLEKVEAEVNRMCIEANSNDYTYEEVDRNFRDEEE